jgi:ferric-dicitrate binding protein FerR (iron transport regulator)
MDSALCAGFRVCFEDYRFGRLETSRRLLVEDHLGRCASCRRALAEAEAPGKVQPMPVIRRRVLPAWSRWAIAAGVAAMALYLGRGPIDKALAPSGPRATVVSVRGNLYEVPQGALKAGATLGEGEVVRTGADSRALLRLADGSRVEVNERTELFLEAAWSGQSIHLERGDVIVQAARQPRGRLRVVARDSVASVKGTVFAVSTGLAGSLVSVVEGSVQVTQPSGSRLLQPGQRLASTAALGGVSVRRSVAWSEDAEKYYALLGELANIEQAVAATATPAPRTEARLLALLPASPVVYVAIPNLGPTLRQAVASIEQRAQESEVLREWWTSAGTETLKIWIDKMQTLSPLIGDEIVFVLSKSPLSSARPVPSLLAEVQPGRQDSLRQALTQSFPGIQPVYQVSDTLMVVSDSPEHLAATLAGLGQGASTPFAAEIAAHYQDGVGVLVGIDAAVGGLNAPPQVADVTGASKLKYFFFDQRSSQGIDNVAASLVFSGPRTGVASWLATPGAAGSAEYASADAVFVVSASTRDPREAFDEFSTLMSRLGPMYSQGLAQFESHTGVSVANDIASAFGTDFTLSIERPTIPLPGWVAALEVVQPSLIDSAARRFVDAVNAKLAAEGQPALFFFTEETVEGRKWVALRSSNSNITLNWTYDRGYMIVSADRGLAAQAIATRSGGGFPLIHSVRFQGQLPASVGLHQSGFAWLNTQGALADVAGLLGAGQLKTVLGSREPILVVVDAERERIRAASRTRLMSMIFTAMLAGGPKAIQNPPRQSDPADVTRH